MFLIRASTSCPQETPKPNPIEQGTLAGQGSSEEFWALLRHGMSGAQVILCLCC